MEQSTPVLTPIERVRALYEAGKAADRAARAHAKANGYRYGSLLGWLAWKHPDHPWVTD